MLAFAVRAASVAVCAAFAVMTAAATGSAVTGTATYRERIALPPEARLEVTIADVARAGAPAATLGTFVQDAPGQPPFAFAIPYDPASLDPRARYAIRATVTVGGALWFTTDATTPVISNGATQADLMMKRVGGPGAATAPRRLMSGAFRYMADAATFEDCRTGETVPVAAEDGYLALERAYLAQRAAPGEALFVTLEGAVETRPAMEGPPRPHLVVGRFLAGWPGETCERNRADASLTDTYWRIAILDGQAVGPVERGREPSLILRGDGRAAATAGCNRLIGAYRADVGSLGFGDMAGTMMACPPPLDARERALRAALEATRGFAIAGPALVLYGADGAPLVVLKASALR